MTKNVSPTFSATACRAGAEAGGEGMGVAVLGGAPKNGGVWGWKRDEFLQMSSWIQLFGIIFVGSFLDHLSCWNFKLSFHSFLESKYRKTRPERSKLLEWHHETQLSTRPVGWLNWHLGTSMKVFLTWRLNPSGALKNMQLQVIQIRTRCMPGFGSSQPTFHAWGFITPPVPPHLRLRHVYFQFARVCSPCEYKVLFWSFRLNVSFQKSYVVSDLMFIKFLGPRLDAVGTGVCAERTICQS